MSGIPFPRNARLPADAYSNREHTFHVVIHAFPDIQPFRAALGQAIWGSLFAELDRQSVQLLAACLMPDHLHTIVKPLELAIPAWVHNFKSVSTHRAREQSGPPRIWQPGFYDRRIRDEREYDATLQYVLSNPSKANLADWPFVYPR